MSYNREIRVEFGHCDPAGIVFYPRYFEMLSAQVEHFFRDRLDMPLERIHLAEDHAVPTVRWEVDFRAPGRLGEVLALKLKVKAIGRTSLDLHHEILGPDGAPRLEARQRLVWVAPGGRPAPWPENLRAALAAQME